MATIDPDFPLRELNCLIVQREVTLNLLQSSKINSKLLAYAYMFGEFDYNKTPIFPPGTKVIALSKPKQLGTLEMNGEEGWYLGPYLEHRRFVNCPPPKKQEMKEM